MTFSTGLLDKKIVIMMYLLTDSKTEIIANIIQRNHKTKIKNLLVVGCGSGIEAAIIAQRLRADVVGIDIDNNFDEEAAKYATLQKGDAMALEFEDASFDFVYCYHTLEHIQAPLKALEEMNRVLKNGGGCWVGTPNRLRIIGYVGGKDTTLQQKIQWNLNDWKARLTGRFKNELGAHAGFSSRELHNLLKEAFPTTKDMKKTYFSSIYERHPLILKMINLSGLSTLIYPSVYFIATK